MEWKVKFDKVKIVAKKHREKITELQGVSEKQNDILAHEKTKCEAFTNERNHQAVLPWRSVNVCAPKF